MVLADAQCAAIWELRRKRVHGTTAWRDLSRQRRQEFVTLCQTIVDLIELVKNESGLA